MRSVWRIVGLVAIAALLIWRVSSAVSNATGDHYPGKPIQVVVPYTAGGGTDNFVRLVAKAIADGGLLEQPMVIINQPGGSGTIGSRFVKDSRPDGYRLLCHHESIITAKLSGTVNFGPETFQPVAQTGNIELVVVVREDSSYRSIRDLLSDAKERPNTVRFGANLGSPAHFTAMQLEAAYPGAKLNLITTGGGQKRYISLIGGHLEGGIFSLAEYLSFRAEEGTSPDKNIRALALLSDQVHPDLPNVPTCQAEGIDVTSSNAYYWWAPSGTPPDAVSTLADALEKAMQDPEVLARLGEWSIGTEFSRGESLRQRITARTAAIEPLAESISLTAADLPNFPLYASIIAIALAVVVVIKSLLTPSQKRTRPPVKPAAICFAILVVYILLLQFAPLPFALTTSAMVFLSGAVISARDRNRLLNLAIIALLCGLGSEFIFTQIFTVPLP